jgi:hypothetical protein
MNIKARLRILPKSNATVHPTSRPVKKGKRVITITISKRQRFVIGVICLSLGLFLSGNNQIGKYAFQIALTLAFVTDIFLLWGVYTDLKENFAGSVFILPFFFSLAFGLFYFLIPARFLFRLVMVMLYAFGLYSLFLVQNIFTVSSIRTIALLSGARIVSIVITLLSYFFLSNILFSLHLSIFPMLGLFTVFTYLLAYQSIRTYALQKNGYPSLPQWTAGISLCLIEAAAMLWFWPSSPTVLAIFLAGFFYTLVGLSHIWFERRLFKGVLWEYLWVGVAVFFILVAFTAWGK